LTCNQDLLNFQPINKFIILRLVEYQWEEVLCRAHSSHAGNQDYQLIARHLKLATLTVGVP